MKIKKSFFIVIIFVIIFIILGLVFLFKNKTNFKSENQISEFTPQAEMSEDDLRKTIICLYFQKN